MTTNHHTPISVGDPANALTFNAPLGQLDSAIDTAITDANSAIASAATNATNLNNLKSGADGFSQLSLTTSTTLTISSGQITISRTRHLVDTEASGAYDDLDTINGGVAGDVLVLQSVTSARVVVVKHGTGNIFLNGFDVHLDNPRKALTVLHDGTQWVLIGEPPRRINRREGTVNYFEGGSQAYGVPTLTATGTLSAVQQVDGQYTRFTTDATLNALAGQITSASPPPYWVQTRHNPAMTMWLYTGANIANVRWVIGFNNSSVYTSDDYPSASTSAIVFRYSTPAGDSGFRPVVSNGTTQTVGSVMATISANTAYKLSLWVVNAVAYFSINDGTPVAISTNVPAGTTEMQFNNRLRTLEGVAKYFDVKRIWFEVD